MPGLRCSGTSPDGRLVEFIELPGHPFYIGTQAHPEFKSRPDRPHPLFREFIGASVVRARARNPHLFEVGLDVALLTQAFRQVDETRAASPPRTCASSTASFVDPDGSSFERQIVRHPGAVASCPWRRTGLSS